MRNLVIFQIAILGYLLLVLVHFFTFAFARPKINNSLREWRCIKCKYGLVWATLVFGFLTVQFFAFVTIWAIGDYNERWLEVLDSVKDGYACTSETLYVNVELLKVMYDTSD